jgi:hypothetical protein
MAWTTKQAQSQMDLLLKVASSAWAEQAELVVQVAKWPTHLRWVNQGLCFVDQRTLRI